MALENLCFPLEGEGPRSVWCAFYDLCLNKAIAHNWEDFHCGSCIFKRNEPFPALDTYMKRKREGKRLKKTL